jgi:hypothetical protein
MSTGQPTDQELDTFAQHVAFEISMLVEQVEYYIDTHGPVFPASSSPSPEEEALLESSLVHIRLLDEFLACSGRHRDDIRADFWPGWNARGFLKPDVKQAINAQVAHLSARRGTYQWDLALYARDCCTAMLTFFASIPAARLAAFNRTPAWTRQGEVRFTTELTKQSPSSI